MSKIKSFLFGVVLSIMLIAIVYGAVHQGFSILNLSADNTLKAQSNVDNHSATSRQMIHSRQIDAHKENNIASSAQIGTIKEEKTDETGVAYIDLEPMTDWMVLTEVYTKDDGVRAYSEPSLNASIVAEYRHGTHLQVIDENKDWYAIKDKADRDTYNNEYISNREGLIDNEGWMTVFIQKRETGPIDELKLNTQKLKKISHFSIGEHHKFYKNNENIDTEYLIIEPISKALYESKRSTAVDFLKKQNRYVTDDKGVLTISLPKSDKKVILEDNIVDNDGTREYRYLGHIDGLNQHLVLGQYWESHDYTFYDMTSGEKTQTFIDYPLISPDQKFIIAIYANPYEMTGDITLYTVNQTDIKLAMSADFTYWMPTFDYHDIFWSTDGYLYLPVNHVIEVWGEDGNYNDNFQYIRIKVTL